ncbi:hypothetical protein [Enterococcus avium]|uniref:hypothetical protein n=1 Tax=Enterococcus avium TaxID=33945 RepID=UPI0028900B33|nr:hypothetical protein [Enterococcus avium]MDT2451058.1 hypothetical protein [Enterococcus avium]
MEENITIEFLKEWIDKHNLTKGSFDRIMNDLIYNSGHNYIDNPSLRYWLIDNTYKFRDMLPVKLNENQQVVLEWLEAYADKDSGDWPMQTIFYMWDCIRSDMLGGEELSALRKLTRIEQFEVLAAFAEWGGRKYE